MALDAQSRWQCPQCGSFNHGRAGQCWACGASKGNSATPYRSAPSKGLPIATWPSLPAVGTTTAKRGEAPHPEAPPWVWEDKGLQAPIPETRTTDPLLRTVTTVAINFAISAGVTAILSFLFF